MRRTPPTQNSTLHWREQFLNAGNMAHIGGSNRPRIKDREIENLRSLFEYNPRLSMRQDESLLNMPRSTIQSVLRKFSFLCPFKMQNLHGITNTDKRERVIFARHYQNQHDSMSEYLSKMVFTISALSA